MSQRPNHGHGHGPKTPKYKSTAVNSLDLKILISWGSFKWCRQEIYNSEIMILFAGKHKCHEISIQTVVCTQVVIGKLVLFVRRRFLLESARHETSRPENGTIRLRIALRIFFYLAKTPEMASQGGLSLGQVRFEKFGQFGLVVWLQILPKRNI